MELAQFQSKVVMLQMQTLSHLFPQTTVKRKVRTLADQPFSAGVHRLLWNGRDDRGAPVNSGIYVYPIEAGKFVESRKMVLMR